MQDYLIFFLLLVIFFFRMQMHRLQQGLRASDAKLDALLKHFGVDWSPFPEPYAHVRKLAASRDTRIAAIKAYREESGTSLKDASAVIDKLAAQKPDADA